MYHIYVARVVESSEFVNVPALEALQFDTYKLILKVAPWCVFSNYMHEFIMHSGQIIGMYIQVLLIIQWTEAVSALTLKSWAYQFCC